jgi:valyl-tRNA synthetase
MKVGRRLATKLLNASKFVLGFPAVTDGPVTEPVDLAMLAALADVAASVTEAFEGYDYARGLERAETFFWSFCDDYIELVKGRAYSEGPAAESALRALRLALEAQLRLFAPFLAFATEEVWSWWREGSVHRAPWPRAEELPGGGQPAVLAVAGEVLARVRKAKSSAQVSMKTPVTALVVRDSAERLELVRSALPDLVNAGVVTGEVVLEAGEPDVEVTVEATRP